MLAALEKSLEKLIRQFPCWYSISPNKQFQHITVWLFLRHLYFPTITRPITPSICCSHSSFYPTKSSSKYPQSVNSKPTFLRNPPHHFSVSSSPSSYYCPAFSLKNLISRLCYPSSVLSLFVNQEPFKQLI